MNLLFRGGTVVSHNRIFRGDLRITGEKIAEVGAGLAPLPGEEVHDVSGCYLMPGIIDAHTHFALNSRNTVTADSAYSGSVSAVCGGVTTVIDYADLLDGAGLAVGIERRKAEFSDSIVDYTLHLVLNSALTCELIPKIAVLPELGISSVKLFTTYRSAGYMFADNLWDQIFKACANHNILVTVHAEDDQVVENNTTALIKQGKTTPADHPNMRPVESEVAAIKRLVDLSRRTNCPLYIVHLSSGEGYQLIGEAQANGVRIATETAPHYLLLDESYLQREESQLYVMTPPLRPRPNQELLWQGLADGTISVVATDHCAFSVEQKTSSTNILEILPGVPGVETLLPLVYSYGVRRGRFDLLKLVQLLSTNPAKLFGLYPQKGSLLPGSDGDVVIYDPAGSSLLSGRHLHSLAGYTPFEGFKIHGKVVGTVIRGEMVVADGKFLGCQRKGSFVPARRG